MRKTPAIPPDLNTQVFTARFAKRPKQIDVVRLPVPDCEKPCWGGGKASIDPFRCSPMFGGGRATQKQAPRVSAISWMTSSALEMTSAEVKSRDAARRLWLQRRTTASARKAAVHTQTASRSAYQFGIRLGEGALSRSQWEAATSTPWWRVRTSGVRRSRFYPAEKAAVASVTNVT